MLKTLVIELTNKLNPQYKDRASNECRRHTREIIAATKQILDFALNVEPHKETSSERQ